LHKDSNWEDFQAQLNACYHKYAAFIINKNSASFLLPLLLEGRGIETLLSYHCLTGDAVFFLLTIRTSVFNIFSYFLKLYDVASHLLNNPESSFERDVNKFCVKFRTYIVKYDVEEVKTILSDMFFLFWGSFSAWWNLLVYFNVSLAVFFFLCVPFLCSVVCFIFYAFFFVLSIKKYDASVLDYHCNEASFCLIMDAILI